MLFPCSTDPKVFAEQESRGRGDDERIPHRVTRPARRPIASGMGCCWFVQESSNLELHSTGQPHIASFEGTPRDSKSRGKVGVAGSAKRTLCLRRNSDYCTGTEQYSIDRYSQYGTGTEQYSIDRHRQYCTVLVVSEHCFEYTYKLPIGCPVFGRCLPHSKQQGEIWCTAPNPEL